MAKSKKPKKGRDASRETTANSTVELEEKALDDVSGGLGYSELSNKVSPMDYTQKVNKLSDADSLLQKVQPTGDLRFKR